MCKCTTSFGCMFLKWYIICDICNSQRALDHESLYYVYKPWQICQVLAVLVVSCLTEYGFHNIVLNVFKTCEKGLRREYFVFCSDTYVTSFASFFQRDWFHAIFFQIWQELKSKLTVWLLATPFPHCKLFITFFLTQL